MKRSVRTLLGWSSVATLAAAAFVPAIGAERWAIDGSRWDEIDRAVVRRLVREPPAEVVAVAIAAAASDDPDSMLRQINVLVRAGDRPRSLAAIDRLAGAATRPTAAVLGRLGDFLITRDAWPEARRFLERFPEAEPGWAYVFIRDWAEVGSAAEIDRWLVRRSEANHAFWFAERLRFHTRRGTADRLLAALAEAVRARPTELEPATEYLDAVEIVGQPVDLTWMGSTSRPPLAYDSYTLGQRLHDRRAFEAAIPLLKRSLELELVDRDHAILARQARSYATAVVDVDWGAQLRKWATYALAESYAQTGRPELAQPLIESLAGADMLPSPGTARLAGMIQAGSGARVIENRIRHAEADNERSAEYWIKRGEYYTGRKEDEQAERAFRQALELSPLDKERADESAAKRIRALRSYLHFLRRRSGDASAAALVRQEMAASPVDGVYAQQLVNTLLGLDDARAHSIRATDPYFWNYLAARETWDYTESRLLGQLLRQTAGTSLDAVVDTAIKLTAKAHPTRARELGGVLAGVKPAAAIPLLLDAIRRLPGTHDTRLDQLSLFRAYLDSGDWRAAERLWLGADLLFGPREVPESLMRIARSAARAGERDEALRLWGKASSIDRTDLRWLGTLEAEGMGSRLRGFYEALRRSEPQCWAAAEALRRLKPVEPTSEISPS